MLDDILGRQVCYLLHQCVPDDLLQYDSSHLTALYPVTSDTWAFTSKQNICYIITCIT